MKKINFLRITVVLVLALVGFSNNAFAQNIQWDGGAGTTNWNDAANWVGDVVPGASDNAIFPTSVGTFTVTGTASSAVSSLQAWNNVNLSLDLDLTVTSTNGTVVKIFDGSSITVKSGATLTVTVSGTNAGAVLFDEPNGTFTVESGGTADLNAWRGITSNATSTSATVNNYGVMNITPTNAAIQPNNATAMTIINHPCGIINLLLSTNSGKIKVWSNAAVSTMTNNGLINYAGTTAPISVSGSNIATNNAFYKTAAATNFASGSGTIVKNGVDVVSTVALDAATGCTVDINGTKTGMQAYTWTGGSGLNATNAADGTLDLTGALFADATGPHTITISDAGCADYATEFTVTVENVCPAAVPVELLSFSAEQQEANVLVSWATATEENNDFFTVEKSIDGKNFEVIGIVQGAGFSLEELDYEFVDENPIAGINYYRLKQTDFDGQFEYFDIKSVDFEGNTRVVVYPNPATNNVVINTTIQDEVTVQIFNLTGQLVYQNNQRIDNQLNVNLADFANGTYLVRVTNSETQAVIYQDKLIKQ